MLSLVLPSRRIRPRQGERDGGQVNVSCPECRSVFRVDPAKVPSTAVRARCSVCGGVITVSSGASVDDEFSQNSSSAVAPRASGASERAAAGRGNAGFATALMDAFAAPPVPVRQPAAAPSAPRSPRLRNRAGPRRRTTAPPSQEQRRLPQCSPRSRCRSQHRVRRRGRVQMPPARGPCCFLPGR